jgi:DNA polymerase-3 subunit alpha
MLLESVRNAGMPAVAVTDQDNLFAMVGFYKSAVACGIKPIIGADVHFRLYADGRPAGRIVLLCRNSLGYRNLSGLLSRAYLEGQESGVPVIRSEWLAGGASEGLVALSGGARGILGPALLAGRREQARDWLSRCQELFGGEFCFEVARTGRPGEEEYLAEAVELASSSGAPVIATNDVRFIRGEDFEAHEARVCIHSGRVLNDPARPREYTDQQYLRSPHEMQALFADLPEALANAVETARRCSLTLALNQPHMPEVVVPDGLSVEEYLQAESKRGLSQRLAAAEIAAPAHEPYDLRLQREIEVICRMGFAGYFLIVADFIRWAKRNGIPVGPGRGSGAGSLVAFALGITELDPLKHRLLFERFLNPERVSMPDFDIDFCMDGRDRVIEYVSDRYGRDRVSQIITYGTMAAKAVVRDVGRVLGQPYGFVDGIAKLIPPEPKITLSDAMRAEAEFRRRYEAEDDVRANIDLAQQLEGLVRNAGKHAGGVVIAPTRITDFAPLYRVQGESATVTQFDKDDLEAVGLVKFDFLGLRTLTIIDLAVRTINAGSSASGETSASLAIADIPLDDQPTFELLRSGRTTAVFQLESRGMRDLIKKLKPDHFDDLVALVALFRPGPLQSGMVDDFISRKHAEGGPAVEHLHPDIAEVLESTYGVIVYQEQVMQIAQILAGYTLGSADELRRAMGKKKPEEMAKQRSVFVDGAKARGVESAVATRIFDLMEKFAEYGFNRSHSAAYALLAYQTAWLKAHHPAAFMAAVLSCEMDDTDKLVLLKRDVEGIGLAVLPPHVNESAFAFTPTDARTIRYGLGAIKGLGRSVAESIVSARADGGSFSSLHSFCRRIGSQRAGKRAMEALIKAGALDELAANRASLLAALPAAMAGAEQAARSRDAGQEDMFGGASSTQVPVEAVPAVAEWSPGKRLLAEREALGLYLSGHPFDQYRADARFIASGSLSDLANAPKPAGASFTGSQRVAVAAGLVTNLRKRGNRITLELDDGISTMEVSIFPETYERFRNYLGAHSIVVVTGTLRFDDYVDAWRLVANEISDIDRVIEARASRLVIRWLEGPERRMTPRSLQKALEPFRPGNCSISIQLAREDVQARLMLGKEWAVRPSRELRDRLAELVGQDGFRFVYDAAQ